MYIDNLAPNVAETNIQQLFSQFGVVDRVILLKKKGSSLHGIPNHTGESPKATQNALVQMVSIESAIAAYEAMMEHPLAIFGKNVNVAYSKSQELRQQILSPNSLIMAKRSSNASMDEILNRILLVTVQNPSYPITTDLIGKVFSVYGQVEKIVIFVKPIGLQVCLCVRPIFQKSRQNLIWGDVVLSTICSS